MKVEGFSTSDFRSDVRDPLPGDLTWYLAEIERRDLNELFVISSGDWTDISGGTFRLLDVVSRLKLSSEDLDTQRIVNDIAKKTEFLDSGNEFDTRFIAVTNCPDLSGPFTFIEGNRRSVALCARRDIVARQIFVGTSPSIVDYTWARKSFST